MKDSIKFQINDALRRLSNAKKKSVEISSKIENLQKEIDILEKKISSDWELIASIGMKGPSRDQENPDTEKELQDKKKFNEKLESEKRSLLEEAMSREGSILGEDLSDFDKAMAFLGMYH